MVEAREWRGFAILRMTSKASHPWVLILWLRRTMPLRDTPRMVTFHVNRFIGSLIAKLACAGSSTREDWVYGSSCKQCMFNLLIIYTTLLPAKEHQNGRQELLKRVECAQRSFSGTAGRIDGVLSSKQAPPPPGAADISSYVCRFWHVSNRRNAFAAMIRRRCRFREAHEGCQTRG